MTESASKAPTTNDRPECITRDLSITARPYPETLCPILPGWNILELLIDTPLCQIERIGDTRHGLETDEVPARSAGRIDDHRLVLRPEGDFHALGFSLHPHRRPASGV